MKKIERFLLNTVILVVTSIFIRSMSMTFRVIIANKIGSEGVGLLELIMSIYFLAITIANSGSMDFAVTLEPLQPTSS